MFVHASPFGPIPLLPSAWISTYGTYRCPVGQCPLQPYGLSRFLYIEATRSIFIPPGWDASRSLGYAHGKKLTSTHLYTWVERGTVREKCLAQEHNVTRPGLEPRPFELESSPPAIGLPRLLLSDHCLLHLYQVPLNPFLE